MKDFAAIDFETANGKRTSVCSIGAIAQENQSYFLHTIEKGQSLYSIASMYGVSQSDIIKLNPGSDEKYSSDARCASRATLPTYKKRHTILSKPVRPSTG